MDNVSEIMYEDKTIPDEDDDDDTNVILTTILFGSVSF